MRNLKKFEEYSYKRKDYTGFVKDAEKRFNKIKPDLMDLLANFEDIGIKNDINIHSDDDEYLVQISLHKDKTQVFHGDSMTFRRTYFEWDEVKDELYQLVSFMHERVKDIPFISAEIGVIKNGFMKYDTLNDLDKIDDYHGDDKIFEIDILFSRENISDDL